MNRTISLSLSKTEHAGIVADARSRGTTVSGLLRQALRAVGVRIHRRPGDPKDAQRKEAQP